MAKVQFSRLALPVHHHSTRTFGERERGREGREGKEGEEEGERERGREREREGERRERGRGRRRERERMDEGSNPFKKLCSRATVDIDSKSSNNLPTNRVCSGDIASLKMSFPFVLLTACIETCSRSHAQAASHRRPTAPTMDSVAASTLELNLWVPQWALHTVQHFNSIASNATAPHTCFWRHFAAIILPSRFSHGDLFEWRRSSFFCCLLEIVDFQGAAILKVWRDMNTHLRRRFYAGRQTTP